MAVDNRQEKDLPGGWEDLDVYRSPGLQRLSWADTLERGSESSHAPEDVSLLGLGKWPSSFHRQPIAANAIEF